MIRNLNILVVDDDPTIRELLATYLGEKGYRVQTASGGVEALDTLEGFPADLVISDIEMAGMNGFEFLRRVRADCPGIGIVLMTAYEDEYPLSEALRAGADGYITKPFNLQKFSLIFEEAYWSALSRQDWWDQHAHSAAPE